MGIMQMAIRGSAVLNGSGVRWLQANFLNDRCRGDGGSAGEVNDFADVAKFVKLTGPVVAHRQHVGPVFEQVVSFQLHGFLGEDRVDAAQGTQNLHALRLGKYRPALLLAEGEFVRRNSDDERSIPYTLRQQPFCGLMIGPVMGE